MQQLIANLFKYIALVCLYIVPSFMIVVWFELHKRQITLNASTTIALYALTFGLFLLVLWVLQTVYRKGQPENTPFTIFRWRRALQIKWILCSLPYLAAMLSLGWMFDFFMQWGADSNTTHTTSNQALIAQMVAVLPPAIMVFNIVIFAPIGEELLFRGIFSNYFVSPYKRFYLIISWILSSSLFAALHLSSINAPEFALYACMGLLLGGVYWHTKDLRYAIGVHMANNAVGTIGLYFFS